MRQVSFCWVITVWLTCAIRRASYLETLIRILSCSCSGVPVRACISARSLLSMGKVRQRPPIVRLLFSYPPHLLLPPPPPFPPPLLRSSRHVFLSSRVEEAMSSARWTSLQLLLLLLLTATEGGGRRSRRRNGDHPVFVADEEDEGGEVGRSHKEGKREWERVASVLHKSLSIDRYRSI